MPKKTKGTKEDIEDRREQLKKIIREKNVETQESAQAYLFKEYKTDVSLATIHRDFKEMKFEIITDEKGVRKYALSEEDTRTYNLSQLKSILNGYTTGGFKQDLHVLAISVDPGYADFLGTKIMEVYPTSFMGYLTSSNLLILIANTKDGRIEESFYKDMENGKFITKE